MAKELNPDRNSGVSVASKLDVLLESDINLNGTGDIIFKTSGVERARIGNGGTLGGIAGAWDKLYQLTSTQAFATTSLADVTEMVATVVASGVYEFDANLYLTSPDTAGLEFGINGPSGATVFANLFGGTTTTAATGCNIQALNTKSTTAFCAIIGSSVLTVTGFMTVASTGGSFSIQADKKTSGSGSVLKGSSLRFRRVY